jgi:hypothetical protein
MYAIFKASLIENVLEKMQGTVTFVALSLAPLINDKLQVLVSLNFTKLGHEIQVPF